MITTRLDTIRVRETENGTQVVLATELYNWLEPKTEFRHWVKRMLKYGFIENVDYWEILPINSEQGKDLRSKKTVKSKLNSEGRGGHNAKEYILSLDCAKSIAMLQRNERGKTIRRYFIEVEKQFRAIATPQQISELYGRLQALEAKQIDFKEDWTIDRYLHVNGLYYGFDRTARQQFGKHCTKAHKEQYHKPPKKVPHPSYLHGQNVYPYELINSVFKQVYEA